MDFLPGDLIRIDSGYELLTGVLLRIAEPEKKKSPWYKFVILSEGCIKDYWLHSNELGSVEVLCASQR